jgi:capsular polysaccharide biosynthesis protein
MNSQNDEIEIDLREIFILIMNHLMMVISVTVIGAVLAGLISVYALTPMYTSTAKMYILANSDTIVSLTDLQMGSSLANDYEELIKSRPVVEQVAENLDLDVTYGELLGHLSITNKDNTRIIQIQITYPDPVAAKEIANEFVAVSQKRMSQIMKVSLQSWKKRLRQKGRAARIMSKTY